jgi:hypothetical protein
MIVELSLFFLAFAKIQPAFSTLVQAYFIFATVILFLIRRQNISIDNYVFIFTIFGLIIFSTVLNEGNIFFAFKNGIYLLTLPLLSVTVRIGWVKRRIFFIAVITAMALIWYSFDPTSYITNELGGTPRMVGFGVNPNVWGVTCVLILTSWRIWPFKSNISKLVVVTLLLISIYQSGSSTALLCLPLAAALKQRFSWVYLAVLVSSIITFFIINDDDLMALVPSLFARFDLWLSAFNEIRPHTWLVGNGYDFFGAGIATVASKDILIVDSFYVSSLISGGILAACAIIWYFMISPLIWAIRHDNQTLLSVVLIFIIANATGNFLENGFPANLIYWILVLELKRVYNLEKMVK